MWFKKFQSFCFLLVFFLFSSSVPGKSVYVLLSSDTSIWYNTEGGNVKYTYDNEFDFDVFSNNEGVFKDVFDSTFRTSHTDSSGTPFKISWFMHCGGWFLEGINTNAISTLYLIRQYWQHELDKWGDELAYHFHHFKWSGSSWVMADTFGDTIWDFDWAMSQMIMDEGVYPVCFRSGWNYMSNEYQNYLEKWIPFRMEGGSWMTDCTPYHPSFSDYRVTGTMKGWEVRHYYMPSFYSNDVALSIFNAANQGNDQVVCIWSHQNESNFIQQIANVDDALHTAATAYPDVDFFYCTGKEAMQKWQDSHDITRPLLNLDTTFQDNLTTVIITTEQDIYQIQPWVAVRNYSDEYARLDTKYLTPGTWTFAYSSNEIDRAVVGVLDIYGNVSLAQANDGSQSWATQSEFYSAERGNIDVETLVDSAILATSSEGIPVVEQLGHEMQTDTLRRSYWIGQTFIPRSSGISKVVFGAKVNSPVEYRVELRPTLPDGFPDDNPAALLSSDTVTLTDSGTAEVSLDYDNLITDGRSYVLLFKLLSGNAEIRLNTTSVYPDGMLIRAYSLDWITIPEFDCQFQIYDEAENLSIDQSMYNSDAFISERGFFVAQTFDFPKPRITAVEVKVTESATDEILQIDLRKTLPDGSPDFSFNGRLLSRTYSLPSTGIYTIPFMFTIPEYLQESSLALAFLVPSDGKNSIRLASDPENPYPQGALYVSDDLTEVHTFDNQDLYFRIFGAETYTSSGTLALIFDAGDKVTWKHAQLSRGDSLSSATVRCAFRFGNSWEQLDSAPWSDYFTGDVIDIKSPVSTRYIQSRLLLIPDQNLSPIIERFEIFYNTKPLANSELWIYH